MSHLIRTFLAAAMLLFAGQMAVAHADIKIRDESSAIKRAVILTGLDRVSKKTSAHRITIHGDTTPFLATQFESRKAWRVEFDDVSFTGKIKGSPLNDPYQFQRKFIVLLDAKTGQLIEVKTDFTGNVGAMKPEPDAMSAEKELKGSSEVYSRLPDDDPKVSFFDAVNNTVLGCPMVAREVNGLYVMDSHLGAASRAVWIITLRGLPPMPLPAPDGANPTTDTGRTVIDAATGTCLFGTNFP